MHYGNMKRPSNHFNWLGLGSATLLQLACLGESDPNFPIEKFPLGQQNVKRPQSNSHCSWRLHNPGERHTRPYWWHNQFYNTQRWPTWTSHGCYRCDTPTSARTHTHTTHTCTHAHVRVYQHARTKQLLDWICINNNSNMHVIILCPWKHGIK